MKPTILVVDDELLLRMDLAEMASRAGFEAIEASSASDAIDVLESDNDIRVVFTDIKMPGDMDGLALAHYVRDRWPPTIIVICSGNLRPLDHELPKDTIFLPKPCTGPKTAELLSKIFEEVS